MDEKKIHVKLSTIIFIAIIIVLVIALIIIGYFRIQDSRELAKIKEESLKTDQKTVQQIERSEAQIQQNVSNNTNNEEINAIKEQYTYDNIKGTYKEKRIFKRDDGTQWTAKYALYLSSDGTFVYENTIDNAQGIMGNYIINDKEIVLNKLFSHGSDIGITEITGQIKLTINDDGSLTDKNNLLEDDELTNIKLNKETSSINEELTLSAYIKRFMSYIRSNY